MNRSSRPRWKQANTFSPAGQRALATAEILCIIFSFLSGHHRFARHILKPKRGGLKHKRKRLTLLDCAVVNSSWYPEAMRLIWIEPTAHTSHGLAPIFDYVPVHRRQVYAEMILTATIQTVVRVNKVKSFDGVNLHNLQSLTLLVHTPAHSAILIPQLICPAVKELSIGSVEGYYNQDNDKAVAMWKGLFKMIGELFPNLQHLQLRDKVIKDLRILVKLKQDLGLKSLKQRAWEAPTVEVPWLE